MQENDNLMWFCKNINVIKKSDNYNDELIKTLLNCSLNDTSLEEETFKKIIFTT